MRRVLAGFLLIAARLRLAGPVVGELPGAPRVFMLDLGRDGYGELELEPADGPG